MGKFDSARDEALYELSLEGAVPSSGDVEAPTGAFTLLVIVRDDVATLGNIPAGNFILTENNDGFVGVAEYDSEAEATAAYNKLDEAFGAWATA